MHLQLCPKLKLSKCSKNKPCYHPLNYECRNLNLGLMIKTRACEGAGQVGMLGVTCHVPRSVGECEGINPHTPKWTPTLGVRVTIDSQIFKSSLQGSHLMWRQGMFEEFFISLKISWNINVKNGFASPIWTLETQVMAKKRVGSQVGSLIPDH
jgi:hypothetical protein